MTALVVTLQIKTFADKTNRAYIEGCARLDKKIIMKVSLWYISYIYLLSNIFDALLSLVKNFYSVVLVI